MNVTLMTKMTPDKNMITVDIQVETPNWTTAVPDLLTCVKSAVRESILAVSVTEPCEVCILLTTDEEVRALNKDFRKEDKATNVLSFPGLEPRELREFMGVGSLGLAPDTDPVYLGDMALAYETLEKEAQEQGKSIINHLTHLVVHGTLHLLGYDHMEPEEADRMESLEIKILKDKFNIDNPYTYRG